MQGKGAGRYVMWKFLWLFVKICIVGTVVIVVENLLSGGTWQDQIHVVLNVMTQEIVVFIGILTGVSWLRFRKLLKFMYEGKTAPAVLTEPQLSNAIIRTLRFPFQLVAWFLGLTILASLVFHVISWGMFNQEYGYSAWSWLDLLESLANEQSLSWLLAVMMYSGCRQIIRPIVSWLTESRYTKAPRQISLQGRLIGVSLALTVTFTMQYLNLELAIPNPHELALVMLAFCALALLLAYGFIRAAIRDTVADINQVRMHLQKFNELPFPLSTGRLDVNSLDEVGDLKVQFNALQEKAEVYYKKQQEELQLAYRVQSSLMPKHSLKYGRLSIEGHWSFVADVGGDFYDCVNDGTTVTIMIGDVAGKGLPSALVSSMVLGLFRSEIRHGGTAAEVLNRMNTAVYRTRLDGMYTTAAILQVDTEAGTYHYASAGHLPAIHIRVGEVTEWETSSFPLGVDEVTSLAEISGQLSPGDAVFLYTDGLLESRNEDGEVAGFSRLHSWVQGAMGQDEVASEVAAASNLYRGGLPRDDDETMVVIRFGDCDAVV